MIDQIVGVLRAWLRLIRALEAVLIDAIAATAPWLAPVIPAYMTWQSMTTRLVFPEWVALLGALVVESLGLSAVTTAFQLWDYNDASRRQTDQAAPVKLAVVVAIFYMSVILTVNVLMDDSAWIYRLGKALLSSLSILAAVILAIRAQHARRLEAISEEKLERRLERQARRLEVQAGKFLGEGEGEGSRQGAKEESAVAGDGNFPESGSYRKVTGDWRNLPPEDRQRIAGMPTQEIAARYGISERTARNWRANARANGNGYKQEG